MAAEATNELTNENANPRAAFYKKPIKKDNYRLEINDDDSPQEIRRQRLLYYQKKSRDEAFNIGRGILEDAYNSENDAEEEEMEVDKKPHGFRKHRSYANRLMLSEWMLEVPQDYLDMWLTVACPQGRRTLLIACKGRTKAYSRRGILLGKFNSALPGGHPDEHKRNCTILDCIWINEKKMYYALDILVWSNQPLLNCDTEFRFFWLKSQLDEIPALSERNTYGNAYPIVPLPNAPCNSNLYEFLESHPSLRPLDGILFYHRKGHYSRGRTPLVTWLKSFMLPEVLGISVPPPLDEKPEGYIDCKHFVCTNRSRKRNKKSPEVEMET